MTKNIVCCLLFSIFAGQAYGQTISHYTLPYPANMEASTSANSDIQNLVWNKWDTKNFVILSLDKSQGEYLFNNIELMKEWSLHRWGVPGKFDFSAPCKILCVPNRSLMKKLFHLDRSYAEVRFQDGKIKESVLWLVLDDLSPAETIPAALTVVCLREFEQIYKQQIGFWAHRGMAVLNGTPNQIKHDIGTLKEELQQDSEMFFGKGLFETTEETWRTYDTEKKNLFDKESAVLCLLIRKEFGQDSFWKMATKDDLQILGFKDYAEFDTIFKKYVQNLVSDVSVNKTPISYLQINAKGN